MLTLLKDHPDNIEQIEFLGGLQGRCTAEIYHLSLVLPCLSLVFAFSSSAGSPAVCRLSACVSVLGLVWCSPPISHGRSGQETGPEVSNLTRRGVVSGSQQSPQKVGPTHMAFLPRHACLSVWMLLRLACLLSSSQLLTY